MLTTKVVLKGMLALALALGLAVPAVAMAATRYTTRTIRLELLARYGNPPSAHHWYTIGSAVPVGHKFTSGDGMFNVQGGDGAGLLYELVPYRSVAAYCADSVGHAVGVGHGVSFCAGTSSSIGRFAKELSHNVTFVLLAGEGFTNGTAEHIAASANLR
jgi:hypothetical protein